MANSTDSDPRLQGLIKRLLELTRNGTIHWERINRRSVEPFIIDLTESSIRLRSLGDNQRAPYFLDILNSDGIRIETIRARDAEETEMFEELYQLARREVLNVDEVINSVIRDLNEEQKGKNE